MSTAQATRVRVRPGVYLRTNGDGTSAYEIVYRDSSGHKRRESVGPRLKEAEARLAQVKADMSRGVRLGGRQTLTVAQAAAVWIDASGHLRDTTIASYNGSLKAHILPAFGRRRLETVTPTTCPGGRSGR